MNQTEKTKAFILRYFSALYGAKKTESLLREYISDQKLIDHALYFDRMFPNAKLEMEEMIVEKDKAFLKVRLKGIHAGEVDGIPPTYKEVNVPFALSYTIKNDKIVDFWSIADQKEIFRQLGLDKEMVKVDG